MDDKAYWVALQSIPLVGTKSILLLVNTLGSARSVWEASATSLSMIPGLAARVLSSILRHRVSIEPAAIWLDIEGKGIGVCTICDPEYPPLLAQIADPPAFFYYRGVLPVANQPAVAIVGSRQATAYGRDVATRLARDLALVGTVIVSGLARGIDSCAHQGALEAGGRTVAVLGSGLDVIYPPENTKLAEKILLNGAIISEFPPGTPPNAINFPVRNRIISGLAHGVVVVEAGEKSGSLITASLALDQGRDVFAVPGQITSPASVGTNKLIQQGAKPVLQASDVWEEYFSGPGILPPTPSEGSSFENLMGSRGRVGCLTLATEEREVMVLLQAGPVHIDTLATASGLDQQRLNSILTFLELRGLIQRLPGRFYRIVI